MKIECDVKDIVRFRDVKIGQRFREIDARMEAVMLKTTDVFRTDGLLLNAVYLSNGEFERFGEMEEVELLPNMTLVNRFYGVANEN